MLLAGKKGLVLNVTNKNSIGWAIAQAAVDHGAQVGVGAQNDRMLESVHKLIEGQAAFKPFTVDFLFDEQFEALAEAAAASYGKLDFVVHSAAYAPREALSNPFIQTTRDDFKLAMEASAYSLVSLCRVLEPVLNDDASVFTLSYLGSQRVMPGYNVMGVAKAALESSARYLAHNLGERGIRVNVLSPGPINTVSARGVKGLTDMIARGQEINPLKRPAAQEEVASSAVYLISDLSRGVTGQIIYVDAGYNVMAQM